MGVEFKLFPRCQLEGNYSEALVFTGMVPFLKEYIQPFVSLTIFYCNNICCPLLHLRPSCIFKVQESVLKVNKLIHATIN